MPRTTWSTEKEFHTTAYGDWAMAEEELCTFFKHGLDFAAAAYAEIWRHHDSQPADGEGPETVDLFYRATGGMDDLRFNWLLRNLVLRDAVTLYEVYLEQLLHEMASSYWRTERKAKSPSWLELEALAEAFDVPLRPPRIDAVVRLRDLLTHRRGELVTAELFDKYDRHSYDFPDHWVNLTSATVARHIRALSKSVARIDDAMRPRARGGGLTKEEAEALLMVAPDVRKTTGLKPLDPRTRKGGPRTAGT